MRFNFFQFTFKVGNCRFVAFSHMRLQKRSKFVSNKDIFNDIAPQLVSFSMKKGFKLQLNHLL